jgi:uncharacterized membrane protein YcaP (DUF421 family)
MWQLHDVKWWEFVVRASVVYLVVMALLRLGGKRQVGQMGMAQLVALLLISNAVQNAMNGNDGSITGGIILATVIMVWSYLFELLTSRSKRLENLIQGRPTLLIRSGKLLRDNLRRERLSVNELRVILRRQGIHDLRTVDTAILESDGFISVWKKDERAAEEELGWAGERNDVY